MLGPFELGSKDEHPRPRRVEVQGSSGPSLDPYNTRVHLQGAPQRLASDEKRRPHLRALSGATRCYAAVRSQLASPTPRLQLGIEDSEMASGDSCAVRRGDLGTLPVPRECHKPIIA